MVMELYGRFMALLSAIFCQPAKNWPRLKICTFAVLCFIVFFLFFFFFNLNYHSSIWWGQSSCLAHSLVDTMTKCQKYWTRQILEIYWGNGPSPFLPMRDLWMWGMTPPPAMVALIRVSSSSSPRMASCRCLGVILFTFRSFDALPASSSTCRGW